MSQAAAQVKKVVKFGEYVLTGKIGQGGIAEIYKGHQESLDREVAIKVLSTKLTSDEDIVRRFERESLVIAKLNHPNIVHVIDKGKTGGRYYFVMDYINGTSLREVIDSDRIDLRTKLEMIAQVCKGLDYAHKNGVIHRDIKPANVLIDRQGNALVADFGIAQIVGTPEAEMTASDVVMGTLSYMSPEQKMSSTNVDQTTDIYAVGVILYEILTAKKPLGSFKMPSELNPNNDIRFDDIVKKCLAQDAADRYQTAVELKDAIFEVIGGHSDGTDPGQMDVSGSESFLGKCRYLDTIRETEFGSTILVENRVSKNLFVIKRHSKGEAGKKEAKLLSTLKHKNIINILGAGKDKKGTVVISEYAQGGSLADRMVRTYGWEKAFEIIRQVASGLDFAHKNNILHGNIRPSNLLFDADEVIKLTDFAMPVHYDDRKKRNWYSSPERKKSKPGDIYGMGVILHQLLIGRTPAYDSGNNLITETLRADLPDELVDMLGKMLAIRVSRRYQSCEAFLLDWEDYDRRREEAKRRRALAKPAVQVDTRKTVPLWLLVVTAFGVLFGVGIALYFTGYFN